MRTLVLGPNADLLAPAIGADLVASSEERCSTALIAATDIEAIVSFGHRHIVPVEVLRAVEGRALNLHISLLPWNRGSDPNLWSWLEHTPKGVSVHWMTPGLDRGELAGQRQLDLDERETLRQTYERLQRAVVEVFAEVWPAFRDGTAPRRPQPAGGSYHRSADKDAHVVALDRGWDTRCADVADYGRRAGLWIS